MDILAPIVDHAPYLGLFLMLLLGGIGLPMPEDATLILCGFLIAQEVVKPFEALAVVYPGLLIADSLLYSFGKRFGRVIVTRKRFHRILPPERLAALESKFSRSGSTLILFGRHVAGLRVQLFLVAGIMNMPFIKFLLMDALSSIITLAIMIGIGYAGGNSLQVLQKDITRIEHIGVVVVLAVLTGYLLYRYFRKPIERDGKERSGGNGP